MKKQRPHEKTRQMNQTIVDLGQKFLIPQNNNPHPIYFDLYAFLVDSIFIYNQLNSDPAKQLLVCPNTYASIRTFGKDHYDEAGQKDILELGIYGKLRIENSPEIRVSSLCNSDSIYLFNEKTVNYSFSRQLNKSIFY